MSFTTVKANAVLFVVYLSFKAYTMDLSFVRLFCLLLNQLIRPIDLLPEAFSRRCSVKMLFLKIWQNSQSLFLKFFDRCIHKQISDQFETTVQKSHLWISKNSFRNGYNTQDCLLAMVESCKKAIDQGRDTVHCLLTFPRLLMVFYIFVWKRQNFLHMVSF